MTSLTISQGKLIDDDIKSNKDDNGNYVCMFCKKEIGKNKKNCIAHLKQYHPYDLNELIATRINLRQAEHEKKLAAEDAVDAALENVGKEDDDDDSNDQYTSDRMDPSVTQKDNHEQIMVQVVDLYKQLKQGLISEEQYMVAINALDPI